jgi:elongation factor P
MLKSTELRVGKYVLIDGFTFEILDYTHKKLARGGAIVKTKIRNLESGEIIEKTFKSQDKIKEADLNFVKCQFLYASDSEYNFMNSSDFSQFTLSKKLLGNKINYLVEGSTVDVVFTGSKPIGINLPVKVAFKVTQAQPGVKGDTQSAATKEIMVETGFKLQAPLFINKGDSVIIDTRDGKYIERAS